jgi:hypothetical protein
MQKNPPMELAITVMLHKTDDSKWTEEELSPVKEIVIKDITLNDSALGALIVLADGEKYDVDFKDIDGNRMC